MATSQIIASSLGFQLSFSTCNHRGEIARRRPPPIQMPSFLGLRTQWLSQKTSCHDHPVVKNSKAPKVRAAGTNGAAIGAGASKPKIANLKDGKAVDGPDLSVHVNGLTFPNPFVIGSGPPGTNYTVMKKVSILVTSGFLKPQARTSMCN